MSSGARARGGRPPPPGPSGAGGEPLDDAGLLFRRLEQADTEEADQIKELFMDNLRLLAGEAWLLNGLIDYYVSTGSARCLEILLSCEEANSRSLIDRLHQLLKTADQRAAGLRLLGYYVRKHPGWLRKLVTQSSPSIVRDLFRIIRQSDCDVRCVISAALVLTTLMPMFPVALIDHIQELFHVLSRLTQLVSAPPPLFSSTHQRHLHVAVYSYFVRVYAMYPCNLLSFLRQHYGQRDQLPVFNGTIRPLLDHVRMHPLLVTGSNATETSGQRWTRKETHDIVAECAHFSLDVLEASPMDNLTGPLWAPPPADVTDTLAATDVGIDGQEPFGIHEILWSPAAFCSVPRAPAGGDTGDGAAPPETAVEATPDTTPAPTPTLTPLKELENPPLQRPPAPLPGCVQASRALAALTSGSVRPRTTGSGPSSPAKKPPAAFRFSDGDPAQAFSTRLGQVVRERADSGGGDTERRLGDEPPPSDAGRPGSTLRGLRDRRTSGKLSPIKLKLGVLSPVQFSEGAPAVTRPVPRGSADTPSAGGSGGGRPAVSPGLWQPHELVAAGGGGGDHSAEDQEVSDLTRRGSATASSAAIGSLTPFASTTAQLTQQLPAGRLPPTAAAAPAAIPGARAAAAAGFDDDDDDGQEDEELTSPLAPLGLAASAPQSRFDFDLVRHMTRYYSRHVLPGRQYRRTSSCPDLAGEPAPGEAAAGGGGGGGGGSPLAGPRADTATQTEDGPQPAPYEHLLAAALPPLPPTQVSVSPHQLLRNAPHEPGREAELLHELLQYERYKREVHAHRNRRLFDRTRATRRLEEESRELKKQVQIMSVDVAECRRQLQLVKRAAGRAAEEHCAAARRLQLAAADDAAARDQLSVQVTEQQLAAAELVRKLAEQDGREQQLRRELLETSRELSCAREKAVKKVELEARVLDLERRLLVMGQMQPPVSSPTPLPPQSPAAGEPWPQLKVAPTPSGDEARRRAEATAAGLEEQLRERDLTVAELRRLIELMRVKHHEQTQALEERYSAIKEHLQSAHTQLLLCPPPQPLHSSEPGCSNGGSPPAKPVPSSDPGFADLRASIGGGGN